MVVMRRVVRRLLIIQIIIIMAVALAYLVVQNNNDFLAAVYGGSITLSGTLLMAWRIHRAGEVASDEQQQGFIEIYLGAIQKFILTMVMMAFGMGYLGLEPLAILICFAATQLSFVFNKVDTGYQK